MITRLAVGGFFSHDGFIPWQAWVVGAMETFVLHFAICHVFWD
jgi:hypothetical protein